MDVVFWTVSDIAPKACIDVDRREMVVVYMPVDGVKFFTLVREHLEEGRTPCARTPKHH